MRPASRFAKIELSLIRQINALARPTSINLGIGEPNIPPDDELRAMARAATDSDWHYSPNAGTSRLRELISARHGGAFDPSAEVCVTAGTMEGLFAIMQAFVEDGDEVLVPDPGFLAYPALAEIAGATPVPYPLVPGIWEIDLAALRALVTPRTKMIVVNTPSNPTGGILSESTLRAVAALADERGFLVVADEVYSEIYYGSRPQTMLGMSPNVVVVDGMSKSHVMTGLRMGWALADAEVMKTIYKAHQYIATCASVFAQRLAESILANRDWNARWLEKIRAQFGAQRIVLLDALREAGVPVDAPMGAFYAFVPIPTGDSLAFARQLTADADVLMIPGIAFGARGEGFIRISYAADLDAIREGTRRFVAAIR